MKTYFSKIGFILAVAGRAAGLRNAWKFPTLSVENGGFVFVLLHLFFTLSMRFSVFLAEVSMGRLSRSDLANAYYILAKSHAGRWRYGGIFTLGGIFVLSFYLVIVDWVLKYALTSLYYLPKNLEQVGNDFSILVSADLSNSILFFSLSFFLTLLIVSKGLIKGTERLNVAIMPSLFIMLIFVLLYCMSFQNGFKQAFSYLFYPDFLNSKLSSIAEALGLAFFALCLGTGCIVTYSTALSKKINFIRSPIFIVLINLFISSIMGLIVFTFISEFKANPNIQGPGIVFVSLMSLFSELGVLDYALVFCSFLALSFAGVTSAVSIIEPLTLYVVNNYEISRIKALSLIGFIVFVLGICCILSLNTHFSSLSSTFGKDFFTLLDKVTSNILLPLGAIASSIFVGFFVDKKRIYKIFSKFVNRQIFTTRLFFIHFISPITIICITCYQIFVKIS